MENSEKILQGTKYFSYIHNNVRFSLYFTFMVITLFAVNMNFLTDSWNKTLSMWIWIIWNLSLFFLFYIRWNIILSNIWDYNVNTLLSQVIHQIFVFDKDFAWDIKRNLFLKYFAKITKKEINKV